MSRVNHSKWNSGVALRPSRAFTPHGLMYHSISQLVADELAPQMPRERPVAEALAQRVSSSVAACSVRATRRLKMRKDQCRLKD